MLLVTQNALLQILIEDLNRSLLCYIVAGGP